MRHAAIVGPMAAMMIQAMPCAAQPAAGQVLRVQHPTAGARDILIRLGPNGEVRSVSGGASAITSFYARHDRLNFNAMAITRWGPRPMAFAMENVDAIYSDLLLITGECVRNCLRPVIAAPEDAAPGEGEGRRAPPPASQSR
jgi:hypothetical protein